MLLRTSFDGENGDVAECGKVGDTGGEIELFLDKGLSRGKL